MIVRFVALVLVVTAVWAVRRVGGSIETSPATFALGMGFALIAAALAGELAERIRLPRVTGYLLFGLLCGPYVANLISRPMARELQIVNGLAVALIGFIAGLELNLGRLRSILGAVTSVSLRTTLAVWLGVVATILAAWDWLALHPGGDWAARLVVAGIVALVLSSFSPTVTIAVISEARARGPYCDAVLAIVVFADLLVIVLVTLALYLARTVLTPEVSTGVSMLAELSWETLGSVMFGVSLGGVFALYMRTLGRELTIVILVLCAVMGLGGQQVGLDPILSALGAGLTVANVGGLRGRALSDAVERGALPVLVVFFAATGASLNLEALGRLGVPALLIALIRAGVIRISARGAHAFSTLPPPHGHAVWMALVSQAGVTIGLSSLLAAQFPDWGDASRTLIVAIVALNEIVGPILLKSALLKTGEVGAADAAHAHDPEHAPA